MKPSRLLPALALLPLFAGCMHEPIHQGNRIDIDKAMLIQKGDTRFHVEQLLGTPVLKDVMYPRRATYVEQFEDEQTGELVTRTIMITYDEALRVKAIRRLGLDRKAAGKE